MKQILWNPIVCMFLGTSLLGCKAASRIFDADKPMDSSSVASRVSDAAETDLLREAMAVRVNLNTNIATYFEHGKGIRSWKVASARADGISATPTGSFRIHELETCPPWKSTRTEAFTDPCAEDNPLGKTALWFVSAEYGLHGVDASHLESVTAPDAEDRRQSSGCVRNHPDDIVWLSERIASIYGTTSADLRDARAAGVNRLFHPQSEDQGVPVVIGSWSTDSMTIAPPVVRPPAPRPSPSGSTAGHAVAGKNGSFKGGHLRREAKDLSALGIGGSCLIPAGNTFYFESSQEVGQFLKVRVRFPSAKCFLFFGDMYIYKDHFKIYVD